MVAEVSPIRIGLDGFNLALTNGTGVATYGRVLCETLARMGHPVDGVFGLSVPRRASGQLSEILFFDALGRDASAAAANPTLRQAVRRAFLSPLARRPVEIMLDGMVVKEAGGRLPRFDRLFTLGGLFNLAGRYFRRYRRFLPLEISDPPAVMHWTYPLPIRLLGARNVYTIHDLVPLRLPQTSLEDKRYHYRLVQACLRRGELVCTVSEASRRDILNTFPEAEPERVVNTYQAVEPAADLLALGEAEMARRLSALFGLKPRGYFLFFAAIEPKKNLGRLLEAYLDAELETPLVVVGQTAWKSEGELRLLNRSQRRGPAGLRRIHRFDHLPRPLLMLLVRGARAVLFPSLYEGFGLPVAEAMGFGTPVLTSTTSSLPEIAGEAALLADPYDVGALASALRQLDADAALRMRLAEAGLVRADHFSMAAYAERLQDFYGRAMAVEPSTRAATLKAGAGRAWRIQTSEASR